MQEMANFDSYELLCEEESQTQLSVTLRQCQFSSGLVFLQPFAKYSIVCVRYHIRMLHSDGVLKCNAVVALSLLKALSKHIIC